MKKNQTSHLDYTEFNDLENYLYSFMTKYPRYQHLVFSEKDKNSPSFKELIRLMKKEWADFFPDQTFFIEDNEFFIPEDFFIKTNQNISMIRNLRYMPLLLHGHQFIEVNYVIKSNDSLYLDQHQQIQLQDGDVLLSPPKFPHVFNAMNLGSNILDFFIRSSTFDTAFMNLLANNSSMSSMFMNAIYGTADHYILWRCGENKTLKNIVLDAFNEWYYQPKYAQQMIEIRIMEFFLTLMRTHEDDMHIFSSSSTNQQNLYHTLYNYMATHLKSISLPTLAINFNYSERQIIRILKKYSGKTFSELLLDIRMKKALSLLKNPSLSLNEISDLLGYHNLSYFKKVFFNYYHKDPNSFQ